MVQDFLLLAGRSVWSAPWWAAVSGMAAIIVPLVVAFVFNQRKESKEHQLVIAVDHQNLTAVARNIVSGANNLTAAGSNITQHITNHHHHATQQSALSAILLNRTSSRPSVWEIIDSVDEATPYDRPHVAAKYKDFPVEWRAKFDDMSMPEGEGHKKWYVSFEVVHLSSGQESSGRRTHTYPAWVYTYLDIDICPYLKVAKRGDMCWIKGKIWRVEGLRIMLQDSVVVEFD